MDVKKLKASDKKMKKYRDLYKAQKQRYEEALQRYQENRMEELEIISLHKRCNKTGAKTGAKAGAKAVAKTVAKAPRSGYHLFLREQLGKMTGEDRKNYCSIVSRRWKEIKEVYLHITIEPGRSEKPTKSRDNPSVGSMHEETVTKSSVVKKKKKNTETAPKSTKIPRVC